MKLQAIDAQLLAKNLRSLGVANTPQGSQDVFFGSAAQITNELVSAGAETRLAIYPLKTDDDEALAQGLTLAVTALLELTADMIVHRLPQPALELPALGETARLTGRINWHRSALRLHWQATIPLSVATKNWEIQHHSLPELLNHLPQLAASMASDFDQSSERFPLEFPHFLDEATVRREYLKHSWDYETLLFLSLAGSPVSDDEFQSALGRLIEMAQQNSCPLSRWLAQHSLVRSLLPGAPTLEIAMNQIDAILECLPQNGSGYALALRHLAQVGQREFAIQKLQDGLQSSGASVHAVQNLADLYARAHRLPEACEVLQRAIETCDEPHEFALQYARLLLKIYDDDVEIQHLPLTGQTKTLADGEAVLREAMAAFQLEPASRPQNYAAKCESLLLQLELDPAEFWDGFAELANEPAALDELRQLIEELQTFEGDGEIGREILKIACARFPTSIELRCLYAQYLLYWNEHAAALLELESLMSLPEAQTLEYQNLTEPLLLVARDPEFEFRLGEISTELQRGAIRESDLVFLEENLEWAPHQLQLYLMLAAGYQIHNDLDSALEILLEANEFIADEPDLLHHLSLTSWRMKQTEMAFRFLEKGLSLDPLNVPLLVQQATYHLLQEEEELAKKYMVRAESLDERHPSVNQLKAFIARRATE
ncbi:MAG: hypothetical protein OXG09_07945 [Chloroflexi bacterium]|nr:hypothetical protein [Chloroflexota bacterium]